MGVGPTPASFEVLQRTRLLEAWRADLPGSTVPHVVIGLPSYSVGRTVYEHYGHRVPPLENRYLYVLLRARDPATRVVYLSSVPVPPDIRDGYLDLLEPGDRAAAVRRGVIISPEDLSPRSLAEKLLDRGDLIDRIRGFTGGEPALIEAWNVTEAEAELAVALGAPINGTAPACRTLATKSNGRRLLRRARVPVPAGVEDVLSVPDIVAAMAELRRQGPRVASVVVKLDDSVAGDGNVVIPMDILGGERPAWDVAAVAAVEAVLPPWYRDALREGGVVEERIEGRDFRSPSAQAAITPEGEVVVLGTHEQRLGGPQHQVYEGCTFPADAAYGPLLGRYARQVGEELAELGAVGRFSVDFVACRGPTGAWAVHGLEINLRKGGTTHPLGITRLLRGGGYDPDDGVYTSAAGRSTNYAATDNLVDAGWVGRPPVEVRRAITSAGLGFDQRSGTGVVPHLLDCLAVDGRMGYTAIADDVDAVSDLEQRLAEVLRAG